MAVTMHCSEETIVVSCSPLRGLLGGGGMTCVLPGCWQLLLLCRFKACLASLHPSSPALRIVDHKGLPSPIKGADGLDLETGRVQPRVAQATTCPIIHMIGQRQRNNGFVCRFYFSNHDLYLQKISILRNHSHQKGAIKHLLQNAAGHTPACLGAKNCWGHKHPNPRENSNLFAMSCFSWESEEHPQVLSYSLLEQSVF